MNRTSRVFLFLLVTAVLAISAALLQASWDGKVIAVCAIYAVIVSAFLGAQFWGFIVAQTHYSDEVEAPKFDLIKEEEAEWASKS